MNLDYRSRIKYVGSVTRHNQQIYPCLLKAHGRSNYLRSRVDAFSQNVIGPIADGSIIINQQRGMFLVTEGLLSIDYFLKNANSGLWPHALYNSHGFQYVRPFRTRLSSANLIVRLVWERSPLLLEEEGGIHLYL